MEQCNAKIYRFSLNKYKEHNFKRLLVTIVFIVTLFIAAFLAIYSSLHSPFLFYLALITISILVAVSIMKELLVYFRAPQTHKDDSITIHKGNNQEVVSVDIKMQEAKYDEFYSVKKITQLHRKKYIDVEGVIYNESSSNNAANLRIPPHFENMDEIYDELEKMKKQS